MMIKKQKVEKLQTESELNFYFQEALTNPHTRIEFIRKGRGATPRLKVGVMISCIDPIDKDKVIVGFTLCNLKYDDFDKVNWGIQDAKDFGKKVAHRRAMKYKDHAYFEVYSERIVEEKDSSVVYIPQTVHESLANFVFGTYKYYKGKSFPAWVENYFPKEIANENQNIQEPTIDSESN
jgi:hypothetical protein